MRSREINAIVIFFEHPVGVTVDDLQEVRRLNPGPGVRGLMSIIYVFFFVRSLWNHRAPQFPRGGKGGTTRYIYT